MFKNKYSHKIRLRIIDKVIISTIFLCFLATLTFSFLSYNKAKENQITMVETRLQEYTNEYKNSIDDYFQYNFQILEYLSSFKEIYSMNWNQQYSFLKNQERLLNFEHFIIMDSLGKGHYINNKEIKDQSNEEFFRDVMDNEKFLTEPYMEVSENRSITTLSVSIYNNNEKIGALCGVIDLSKIYDIFKNKVIGQGGYGFLIDDEGNYVAHKNMDYVHNKENIFDNLEGKKNNIDFLKLGIDLNEPIIGEIVLDDIPYYASINTLESTTWNVVFLTPKKEALVGLDTFALLQIISLVFGALLIALGMKFIFKSIENYRLAYTDSLTNINNRAAFNNIVHDLDKNTSSNLIVICFDLNNFKYTNDTYGHNIGDTLLCSFAHILSNTLGNIGFICRMGGDEFIAIINDSSEAELIMKLKEIFKLIKYYNSKSKYNLDISYGYVIKEQGDTTSLLALLEEADKNMYKFKKKRKHID